MAYIAKLSRVATDGFRVERNNPDGTPATASRFLGFSGTCDLSAVLTTHAAELTIKIDKTSETKTFTCTAASESAVTVAEAVTDLTTAAFTGITWSADTVTGRLKGVSETGTYVQVTGALAAALDFGQGITQGGNGLEIIKVFDDRVASCSLAKSIVAAQTISQEGSKGTIDEVNIGQKLKGIDPVITINDEDYALLELIEGGTFDRTANKYTPPLSDKQTSPTFTLEFFSPMVRKGSVKFSDKPCEELMTFHSCIGAEGDVGIDSKAYAKYVYNVIATGWTDESSVKHPAYDKTQLTIAEYLALDVENV